MKFKQAVEDTPDVENAYRPGLQAISIHDRGRMSCAQTSMLAGSINLDATVTALYPNDARWDYGIGLVVTQQNDRAIWVEVHPASTSNVKEMINKWNWLKSWLNTSAPRIKLLANNQFYWIASGRVAILRNSPQAKRLAQSGLRYPTKHLVLDNC